MTGYDEACEYAAELGIPEDQIDGALANIEICERYNCGVYGEGPCADDAKYQIRAEAAKRIKDA